MQPCRLGMVYAVPRQTEPNLSQMEMQFGTLITPFHNRSMVGWKRAHRDSVEAWTIVETEIIGTGLKK